MGNAPRQEIGKREHREAAETSGDKKDWNRIKHHLGGKHRFLFRKDYFNFLNQLNPPAEAIQTVTQFCSECKISTSEGCLFNVNIKALVIKSFLFVTTDDHLQRGFNLCHFSLVISGPERYCNNLLLYVYIGMIPSLTYRYKNTYTNTYMYM